MKERISGASFDFYLGGVPVHAESATLSITDNSEVAKTGVAPDGWVSGEVGAEGEIEVDMVNFKKFENIARAAGSYRAMPVTNLVFFASRGGIRCKIEVFGAKFTVSDLLNVDPKGGAKSTVKLPYKVTSKDFVSINGVPYLSEEDTRYM